MAPVLIDSDPNLAEKVDAFTVMKPKCVAKIAFAAARVPDFLRVLQEQLAKHVFSSNAVTITKVVANANSSKPTGN